MNFYGHAHLAARIDRAPAYVLGSMLPDFVGMCGVRLEGVTHGDVARGVALHHATDEIFHGTPEFLGLCASGLAELEAAGLARGAARACAHVGTELVLDGFLLEHRGPDDAYLEALDVAAPERLGPFLRFRDEGIRFESLRRRLRAFGVPYAYADASFVAVRLQGALASRPRLALGDRDVVTVTRWLASAIPATRDRAPALLARVEAALGGRTG